MTEPDQPLEQSLFSVRFACEVCSEAINIGEEAEVHEKCLEKIQGLEQKIKDRIASLEKECLAQEPLIQKFVEQNPLMKGADNQARIDELRKLLK